MITKVTLLILGILFGFGIAFWQNRTNMDHMDSDEKVYDAWIGSYQPVMQAAMQLKEGNSDKAMHVLIATGNAPIELFLHHHRPEGSTAEGRRQVFRAVDYAIDLLSWANGKENLQQYVDADLLLLAKKRINEERPATH